VSLVTVRVEHDPDAGTWTAEVGDCGPVRTESEEVSWGIASEQIRSVLYPTELRSGVEPKAERSSQETLR